MSDSLPAYISAEAYWTLLFNNHTQWSAAGGAVKSDAAGYVDPPHFNLAATINVQSTASGYISTGAFPSTLFPTALDLSRGTDRLGYFLELAFYLDTGVKVNNLNQIKLRFYSGANWIEVIVAWTSTAGLADPNHVPGWHKMYFGSDQAGTKSAGWTDSMWVGITGLVCYVIGGGAAVNVRFGSLRARYPLEKAVVCFMADDGYVEHLQYAEELAARGMRGTFFCLSSLLDAGHAGDFLDWADAAAMDAAGHMICNHTHALDTAAVWTAAAPSVRAASVATTRDAFVANGIPRGARILATPGGELDTEGDREWTENGGGGSDYKRLVVDGVVDHIRLVRQFCRSQAGSMAPWPSYPRELSFTGPLNHFDHAVYLPIVKVVKGIWCPSYHTIDRGVGGTPSWAQALAMLDAFAAARDAGEIYIATFDEVLQYTQARPTGLTDRHPGSLGRIWDNE